MAQTKQNAAPSNIELRIRALYPNMGKAEKKVADWIVKEPEAVVGLSIIELADVTGASEATIARFARRLGYGGFQEMKISAARDTAGDRRILHENLQKDAHCIEIYDKVTADIDEAFHHTRRILSPQILEKAAEAIHNARKVLVIGLGASASVAQDASHKFLREGIECIFSADNHMQAILASHLSDKDVVLAISHSGKSRDIIETLEVAKSCGATTISLSNYGRSPIEKVSDIALHTASAETQFRQLALSARIAQLAVIDTLYLYIALRRDKAAIAAITKVEQALTTKKL